MKILQDIEKEMKTLREQLTRLKGNTQVLDQAGGQIKEASDILSEAQSQYGSRAKELAQLQGPLGNLIGHVDALVKQVQAVDFPARFQEQDKGAKQALKEMQQQGATTLKAIEQANATLKGISFEAPLARLQKSADKAQENTAEMLKGFGSLQQRVASTQQQESNRLLLQLSQQLERQELALKALVERLSHEQQRSQQQLADRLQAMQKTQQQQHEQLQQGIQQRSADQLQAMQRSHEQLRKQLEQQQQRLQESQQQTKRLQWILLGGIALLGVLEMVVR